MTIQGALALSPLYRCLAEQEVPDTASNDAHNVEDTEDEENNDEHTAADGTRDGVKDAKTRSIATAGPSARHGVGAPQSLHNVKDTEDEENNDEHTAADGTRDGVKDAKPRSIATADPSAHHVEDEDAWQHDTSNEAKQTKAHSIVLDGEAVREPQKLHYAEDNNVEPRVASIVDTCLVSNLSFHTACCNLLL